MASSVFTRKPNFGVSPQYGFHGLSYRSILESIAKKTGKPKEKVSLVVAHLGSGGSCCMIRNGESQDTSMFGFFVNLATRADTFS